MTAPDCLFCKIAAREIPAEMIYEDDQLVAIRDINPAAPVHFLLIPKVHIASLMNASPEHAEMLGSIQLLASRLALQEGIAEQGFRLVNNCGEWGGQSVYHLHYHVLGGKPMGWPPE
ncbi:MAG TPA: histidine triad nucleotide-binding protein [Syntrophomonadaceae bacterium]|nr:histidine triad nucleotide-binding protein [Syntrophomonadaceae bacterium]